jgi:hypothetical protein
MANKDFKTLPGTIEIPNSQNVEQFKQISQARWTGSQWRHKGNVIITHGDTGTWSSDNSYRIDRQENMYDPSSSKGLKVYSSSGESHESNYESYGNGRWMPASVWYGLGFESKYNRSGGNDKHDLYIKRYAAIFVHRTSSSYRIYGWNTGNTNRPSGEYRFDKIHSSMSSTTEIRNWGPDWLFQGILIQFANNGGSGSTQSTVEVYNLKIGHKYSTIGGQYRYLPVTTRSWSARDKHPVNGTSRLCGFTNPFTT